MATVTFERTYWSEVVETWMAEVPDGWDPAEWLENDMHGADQYLTDNGEMVDRDERPLDNDRLQVRLITTTTP